MEEVTDTVTVKEEDDASDKEDNAEGESAKDMFNEEEHLLEVDKQETLCDRIEVKEENDYAEEEVMEIASVIMPEIDHLKFENEGGNIDEDSPKPTRVRQKPGPKSRKRKQSESSETDRNKCLPTVGKRRSSRKTATTSRPSQRPIPQTYRDTEVCEPDNLLYCEDCVAGYDGDCPEHGPLIIVEDNEVPVDISDQSRASRTAPPQVRIADSKIPGAGCGVRAVETIPPRTRFGPYEGIIIPIDECTSYSWLIRKDGEPDHCLDGTELGLSNWMRFVNCPRNESERNLVAFQYEGKLYYRTICKIEPDEELLVWCGKEYGRQLGIHQDFSDAVTTKNVKDSPKETYHDSDELDETDDNVTSSVFVSKTDIKVDFIDEIDRRCISTADESPFVCNQCNEYCFDEETLTSHLLTHAGENPFVCNVCNERFFDRKTLTNHQKAHGAQATTSYVCAECFQTFGTKEEISKHERKHNREKPFLCLKCNKRFAQSDELKGHLQFHDGEKQFGCDQCNKRFHGKHQLQKHLWSHDKEKPPFICPGCLKEFSQKFNLEQHFSAHGECSRRALNCSLCGRRCSDEIELHSHMRTEHNGAKPFECLSCYDRFFDRGALSRHERTHAGEKPFYCRYCHRRFLRKMDLRNHSRIHRHKEPCGSCGKRYPSKEEFDAHWATCQNKETFPCPACGKRFVNKSYLRTHLSLHSKETQFVCPECNQEYSSKGSLARHLRTHSNERPYTCNECLKGFKTNAELKVHMTVHSGEKLHVCTICSKKFKFKISFTRHLKTHGLGNKEDEKESQEEEEVEDDVLVTS